MKEYLKNQLDWKDPELVSVTDEIPLWSAPFGLMLLDRVPLKPGINVLDVGFGTGFPILELAQRLGESSTVYGIDSWTGAIQRVKQKIDILGIKNVKLVEGDAASMTFENNFFDLIVSNLGINNFENIEAIFNECSRVAKPGARIALTTNPKGHMEEFYRVLEVTMRELDLNPLLEKLETHIDHRHSMEKVCRLLGKAGFKIVSTQQTSFSMRFLNGGAFLNHALIRHGFLHAWKAIFPQEELNRVFTRLEKNLDAEAGKKKELKITIPMAYIEGEKI
jgi:ubiquinone/menaquinone biosynthesis C-methylase UbiE